MNAGIAHNPFSVSRLGPHGMDYVFPEGQSLDGFLEELKKADWRVELVGPHGAGKSTLLFTVARELERRGVPLASFRCTGDRRRLPWNWRARLRGVEVVFLDGGERLVGSQLRALAAVCRRRGVGLITTTHEVLGIGRAYPVRCTARQLEEVVSRLGVEGHGADHLEREGGNAREALYRMYLDWEERGSGEVIRLK